MGEEPVHWHVLKNELMFLSYLPGVSLSCIVFVEGEQCQETLWREHVLLLLACTREVFSTLACLTAVDLRGKSFILIIARSYDRSYPWKIPGMRCLLPGEGFHGRNADFFLFVFCKRSQGCSPVVSCVLCVWGHSLDSFLGNVLIKYPMFEIRNRFFPDVFKQMQFPSWTRQAKICTSYFFFFFLFKVLLFCVYNSRPKWGTGCIVN